MIKSETVLFSIDVSENTLCLDGTTTAKLSTNLDATKAGSILGSNYRLELRQDGNTVATHSLDSFNTGKASSFQNGELVINENNAEIHLSSISKTSHLTSALLSAADLKDLFFSYPSLPKDCEGQWIDNHILSLSCPEAVRISAQSGNFWLRKSEIDWEMTFQIAGSFDVMVCSVEPSQCTSIRESIVVMSECDVKSDVEEEEEQMEESVSFMSPVVLGSSFVAVLTVLVYLYLFHLAGKTTTTTTTEKKKEEAVIMRKKKVDVVAEKDDVAVVKQEEKIDDDGLKLL